MPRAMTPGTELAALRGLYALTPDETDTARLLEQVRAACGAGLRLLQYRNKTVSPALLKEQAAALRALTREFGACLIINDDPELALAVDADGVHLGRSDTALAAARDLLGPEKLIGISCYNQLSLACQAEREGADYVAFGAFYPSATKPGAVPAGLELLHEARRTLMVPIVAIGGISIQNGAALVQAGADMLAVITALFDAPDIQIATQEFTQLFDRNTAS